MTAETSNARGEWPERYACNGPEGTFWTDDAALANKLIAAAFDRDEWTVTDTQNPTAAAPPPAAARGDVRGLVAYIEELPDGRQGLVWADHPANTLGHKFTPLGVIPTPPAAAEPKTLPVPTRVHLIGETAVIVGTPGRGWDEEGPDAHNCDAMGCATIGPHVLARVPFTDERAMSQPAEAQAQGGGEVGILRTAAEYHYAQATCPRDQFGNTSNHRNPRLEAWHRQVADAITATAAPPSAPVGVDETYPVPRNRAEAAALARLALAHLGVIDAHIDAAIARCETDLATQPQGDK